MDNKNDASIIFIIVILSIFALFFLIRLITARVINKARKSIIEMEPDFFNFQIKGQHLADMLIREKRIKRNAKLQKKLKVFSEAHFFYSKLTNTPIPKEVLFLIMSYSKIQDLREEAFDHCFKDQQPELESTENEKSAD
jgi:hypothetical protein